ncbi:MAG: hypothetical protein PHW72_01055, partial [Candidatus Pacebacteria bacterium]|nr:hypothetical protein [Candidatus Paceibacterota bacterium]
MKLKFKKPIILSLGIIVALSVIGTVGALNGWFGGGSSIPEDTMTRGLVGYWGFEEESGTTTFDASDNGNDGTFMTATSSPSWATGKIGGGLSFDGAN